MKKRVTTLATATLVMTTLSPSVFASTNNDPPTLLTKAKAIVHKAEQGVSKWMTNEAKKLNASAPMTVGHLEADFAAGLGLKAAKAATYFTAKSSAPATVSELELATAKFFGITSWAWEPGRSAWGWSQAIGLLKGVKGNGSIPVSAGAAIVTNLRRMNQGYYWAGHEYHLQYRPFDVATTWAQDTAVNAKMMSALMPGAIARMDAITFTRDVSTNFTTFVAPTLSSNDDHYLTIGSVYNNPATNGGHRSYTAFSFNDRTWQPATANDPKSPIVDPFGYSSRDPANGGQVNPPKTVYVRCYGNAEISANYYVPLKMTFDPVTVDLTVHGTQFSLHYFAD